MMLHVTNSWLARFLHPSALVPVLFLLLALLRRGYMHFLSSLVSPFHLLIEMLLVVVVVPCDYGSESKKVTVKKMIPGRSSSTFLTVSINTIIHVHTYIIYAHTPTLENDTFSCIHVLYENFVRYNFFYHQLAQHWWMNG